LLPKDLWLGIGAVQGMARLSHCFEACRSALLQTIAGGKCGNMTFESSMRDTPNEATYWPKKAHRNENY
jgi:hypothetical protein